MLLLFLSAIFVFGSISANPGIFAIQKKWYDGVIPETGYDKIQPPPRPPYDSAEDRTVITCTLIPVSISAMSAKHMSMTADVRLNLVWRDNRLNTEILDNHNKSNFKIPQKLAENLWYPLMINFPNCKECSDDTMINKQELNMYYIQGGGIVMLIRGNYEFICHFNLFFYPFDSQKCSIQIITDTAEPIGYNHSLFIASSFLIVLPEFHLVETYSSNCSNVEEYEICISHNFILQRVRTRPILTVFIPSILIVCLSWTSFWLDVRMAPARVTLGLTSMLTLITHFNSVQQNLPAVSTIMAQDVWMFGCISGVFASLVEYAFASYNFQTGKINQKEIEDLEQEVVIQKGTEKQTRCLISADKLDEFSRIAFPSSFLVFNLVFWIYYYREVREKITMSG